MSSEAPAGKGAEERAAGLPDGGEARPRPDGDPNDTGTPGSRATVQPGTEDDGPVSEADALQSLNAGGGHDEPERAEAVRTAALADPIAERINSEVAATRMGTVAVFNGSVSFGGGFHSGGGDPSGPPRSGSTDGDGSLVRIEDYELTDHTEFYVHPDGYHEALEALTERFLLVLTALPGTGREATAVNLLAEAMATAVPVGGADVGGACHRVLDAGQITRSAWEPEKNSGYLVLLDDWPGGGHAPEGVEVRRLAGTAAKLKAAHSFLVLVGGEELAVTGAGILGDHVAWHGLTAVDPISVVERRVLGHGEDSEHAETLEDLLTGSGARQALREQPAPRNAVRLASVVRAQGDLAAAVAALRDPSDQVHAWFTRHRDPDAVAFALAAAVLEGSSYLTVADAAVELRAALAPAEDAPPDVRFRERLGHEQPWIELTANETGAAVPPVGPPRVRFRSALLQQVVLAYAWTSLDGRRAAILTWLRRLLTHADIEVRARASVAAGVLAWADHHYALHRFLRTWAGSTSWPVRQAAATALGVAGSRPGVDEAVWGLLHEWASGGTSAHARRLAATAANTVGGPLGRRDPERALALLHTALDRGDDWGTLTPVAWSGVHLIHEGQAAHVLDALLRWSEPQDISPLVVKSLSAFVFAVRRPYEELLRADGPGDAARSGGPGPRAGRGVPGVPLLLSLCGTREYRGRLEELWARSLARKPVQEQALDALREWIDGYADRDPAAPAAILGLLRGISGRPGKHHDRLVYWLNRWGSDRDAPSRRSAELARRLEREARRP
ncbi:hypothetical protein [Streptomyces botrytidirepellens]|uniref:hypothetical protein n=1 Tax=Streptomyces botrytidirepellens TaxID=2486417 RepID=UPI0011CE7C0C|nr:hypothetical protein [Streptomyces botrytidirepellens]